LELDYFGVIIEEDLIYRDGQVLVDPTKRSREDKTIFGYKKLMDKDPIGTQTLLDAIIKNTYRTLMLRGMKGYYVYCVDRPLQEYLKSALARKPFSMEASLVTASRIHRKVIRHK